MTTIGVMSQCSFPLIVPPALVLFNTPRIAFVALRDLLVVAVPLVLA